ncbi:MAG: alanyl-tRNA synthetase, partial [Gammaproteobacteria bacterium]
MTTSPTQTAYTATRVRREFIDFFRGCEHTEVPSGPVFPQDDPTLLFTNAGMNQFKDVFLGAGTRSYRRAVDTQKCIRVSGKHNDLEEVGRDTYHHTFFEMLGNWSFGDYFKEDSIVWAWRLLTEVWALPKERLWVTVFGGDEADGLGADEEAERIWLEKTDIDPSHVLRFDRTDNFWEMGDTGPCGPCSEIHIDRGAEGCDPTDGADLKIGVNAGNERFIELWNLVFMQFNRLDDGKLVDLPAKCVDTGMGFERVLSVLQGKSSNYDTDLFQPIFSTLEGISGKPYGSSDEEANVAFRVCADHIRAVSCALADGALPSNEGRGYVLRRLIRRASRFGRQTLGLEEPFLFQLVPTVAEILGDAFPEVRDRVDHLQLVVRSEEEAFRKTLDRGLRLFERLADEVSKSGSTVLPGKDAYELYATYGFPRDLVELMGRERDLTVDEAGWDEAQAAHREISKSEGKFKQLLSAEELDGLPGTESTCHDEGERAGQVETDVVFADLPADGSFRIVLRESPFYPEAGGQVGDSGMLEALDGSVRLTVEETRKIGNLVVHIGPMERAEVPPGADLKGTRMRAQVDTERRDLTRKNHSATHLMHRALRMVLGDHV